jgi:hypothetical protein
MNRSKKAPSACGLGGGVHRGTRTGPFEVAAPCDPGLAITIRMVSRDESGCGVYFPVRNGSLHAKERR